MLDILHQQLQQYPAKQYWLGLSGGLDSCVLLHMLHSLKIPVKAVHVHHGLSPNADHWAEFCTQLCASYQIPLVLKKARVMNQGKGIEDAARAARYQMFSEILQTGDVLLLAHHSDDQAETFFMRALRGSGVNGLAAMPVSRELNGAILLRPLLAFSRSELSAYAAQFGIRHIHDESNDNNRFERNYWRNAILPQLWQRFPAGRSGLNNTLHALQQDKQLLQELMQPALQACRAENGSLSLTVWQTLSALQQDYVLRHWLLRITAQMPGQKLIQELMQQLQAAADSEMCMRFADYEIRRYRQQAFCLPCLPTAPLVGLRLSLNSALPLGVLSGVVQLSDAENYQVGFYAGGESIRPVKRPSKSLKKLFQEAGIPPWLRDFWPLIYCADELLCIPGIALAEGANPVLQQLHWQP